MNTWAAWIGAVIFHGVVGLVGVHFPYSAPRLALLTIGVAGAGAGGALDIRALPRTPFLLAAGALLLWVMPTAPSAWPGWKVWAFGLPGVYSGSLLTTAICVGSFLVGLNSPGVLRVLTWTAAVSAVHCLAQVAGADPFSPFLPGGRAIGLLGSPVDAGAAFALMASAAPLPWSVLWILGALAAQSRWAVVCIVLVSCVRMLPKEWGRVLLLAAVLAPAASLLLPGAPDKDIFRRDVWRVAAEQTTIFGSGPNTFSGVYPAHRRGGIPERYSQNHAHNFILDAGFSRGALGLSLVACLLFVLWRNPILPACCALLAQSFNPISFEVLALAALLTGMSIQPREVRGD